MAQIAILSEDRTRVTPILDNPQGKIRIHNVIAMTKVKHPLDLNQIARTFPAESDYREEQFPALFFRFSGMKRKLSVFRTGTIISAGEKTELDAKTAIHRFVSTLKEVSLVEDEVSEPLVQNIVVTIDFQRAIGLEKAYRVLGRVIYEPDQFPALIHRRDGLCYLLFAKGTAISLGAKSMDKFCSNARDLELELAAGSAFL